MATADLLNDHPRPSDAVINANIKNLCRCGTYVRVHRAIRRNAGINEFPKKGSGSLEF